MLGLTDLLSERLRLIGFKIDVISQEHLSMDQLIELRSDRLEGYERTYYRQNAVTQQCPW